MKIELSRECLLASLTNHYTTRIEESSCRNICCGFPMYIVLRIMRFCWVIVMVWLIVAGFGLDIWFHLFSSLLHLNSLGSSLSMKAAKELLDEGSQETKMPFKFQLYFLKLGDVFADDERTVTGDKFIWYFWYRLLLAEMGATDKRVSQRAAKRTHGFNPPSGEKSVFPALVVTTEWERVLSCAPKSIFKYARFCFLSEVSGNCYTLDLFHFIFIFSIFLFS